MIRLVLVVALLCLAGCEDFPRDTRNTLNDIESRGVIRVGLIDHARPWAYVDEAGNLAGIEVVLVEDFARTLEARPEWIVLPEAAAIERLRHYELDMVIGGLTANSPRSKEAGFTRPYLRVGPRGDDHHVMALPRGENRFVTTLEKFLRDEEARIRALYNESIHNGTGDS